MYFKRLMCIRKNERVKRLRYALQIIVGIAIFVVSTVFAWYEGSAIVENTFEWEYSTPFTNLFMQEITNGRDISQLDYFVYAAKFQPLFPAIMIVSVLYILWVVGLYLIKIQSKGRLAFWGVLGFLLMLCSGLILNSYTLGSSIFFWISSISGLIFIGVAVSLWARQMKHQQTGINHVF